MESELPFENGRIQTTMTKIRARIQKDIEHTIQPAWYQVQISPFEGKPKQLRKFIKTWCANFSTKISFQYKGKKVEIREFFPDFYDSEIMHPQIVFNPNMQVRFEDKRSGTRRQRGNRSGGRDG
jgi:hypothetical protein